MVTCSKRKKVGTGAPVRVSEVEGRTPEDRARRWVERLDSQEGDAFPAHDLYVGEQWSVIDGMRTTSYREREVRYWVISAGYGLFPIEAELRPYAATFSKDDVESVYDPQVEVPWDEAISRWWSTISEWAGPTGTAWSLARLVSTHPRSPVLLALSPTYLKAIGEDLANAAGVAADPNQILVFSAGARTNGSRSVGLVDFDSRLQNRVQGSLMSLNVRALEAVLASSVELNQAQVQRRLNGWLKNEQPVRRPSRKSMTDEQVRSFIQDAIMRDADAKWSPLLRKLRKSGRACEQSRFRHLFHEMVEQ